MTSYAQGMRRKTFRPGAKVGEGIPRQVGANIYRARQGACVSQATAAECLGVTQSTMSKIEAGKVVPNAVQLFLLARRFNVSVGAFFEYCSA
jgi:DNA-binding XRE family transcriptional regulator